jgi:hypothetical protein
LHYATKTQIKTRHKFYKNNFNEENLIIYMGWCKIDNKMFSCIHLQGDERSWWRYLWERDHLEDQGVDGKLILKWFFKR